MQKHHFRPDILLNKTNIQFGKGGRLSTEGSVYSFCPRTECEMRLNEYKVEASNRSVNSFDLGGKRIFPGKFENAQTKENAVSECPQGEKKNRGTTWYMVQTIIKEHW